MSFDRLDAALSAAVFAHLSDDKEATWARGDVVLATLPVILDEIERPTSSRGLALLEQIAVVRMPLDLVIAAAVEPAAGDVFTVNGALFVVHGTPWVDTEKGRDWVCPVNDA